MNPSNDELLDFATATAKGALVASERDKKAMKKALETIGLLNSMIQGGEQHSEQSRKMMEDAVVDLLHALQFKEEEPKSGAALGGTWAGTPEMAEEFIRQNHNNSKIGKAIDNLRGGRKPPTPFQGF